MSIDLLVRMSAAAPHAERFWSKVGAGRPDDCWLWLRAKNNKGYGQFHLHGKTVLAHRTAYELLVGPIPPRLQLDHSCLVKSCVNPAHLEPVTHSENLRRHFASITKCPQGHLYTPENTWTRRSGRRAGSRDCRACGLEYNRTRRTQNAKATS